jgi:hypothetical protein
MKRLVWLLILAFGTAISQVRAVDVRLIPEEKCCCCEDQSNACGMPDCATVPTAGCAQPCGQLQSPVPAAAKRAAPAFRAAREKFYEQFLPRIRVVPALPVTDVVAAPAASVPLFREHCSFLI